MNFIPTWSISVLFLILFLWVIGLALCKAAGQDMPSILDVPCQSCQHGYGEQHGCEDPDYCACDQSVKHINGPDVCNHGLHPEVCLRCWLDMEARR